MLADYLCVESPARPRHVFGGTTGCLPVGRRSQAAVCIQRLVYGFTKAADRQRVDAFLARCKRNDYCAAALPSFEELLKTTDQQLFGKLTNSDTHLLHGLLPPPTIASQNYTLRSRPHNRQLPERTGHLTDSNFITRMLYLDSY